MKSPNFPYEYFDEFIQKFILKKTSMFSLRPFQCDPKGLLILYEDRYWTLSEGGSKQVKFETLLDSLKHVLGWLDEVEFLNHAIWLWTYSKNQRFLPVDVRTLNMKVYVEKFSNFGFAEVGSDDVQDKSRGVLFCLYLISQLWDNKDCNSDQAIRNKLQSLMTMDIDLYSEDGSMVTNEITCIIKYKIGYHNHDISDLVIKPIMHIVDPEGFEPSAEHQITKE